MTAAPWNTRLPLAAAPMVGGPSTMALARAVAAAGAFPFLAGGSKTAAALAQEIDQLRPLGTGSV
ncbi:MAG: nitronate monooxygenase [Cellulomonadaceae bacterium]